MKITDVKKKFFKANQFIGEKMGITHKNIKIEEDLKELEKKCDVIGKVLSGLNDKTEEYVQPNAILRSRLRNRETNDKLRGNTKENKYPQTEILISNFLVKNSKDVPNCYGKALDTASSYFAALGDCKDTFENEVLRGTLEPISVLRDTDLKDISKCKKRLESRRLDLEAVTRRKNAPEEEVSDATIKFENISIEAYNTFLEFAENKEEQFVQQLFLFAKSIKNYHQSCAVIAEQMEKALEHIYIETKNKPKKQPRAVDFSRASQGHANVSRTKSEGFNEYDEEWEDDSRLNDDHSQGNDSYIPRNTDQRMLKALFDFESEADDELCLKAGDIIKFVSDVDENWIEGELHGRVGIFPRNFVKDVN